MTGAVLAGGQSRRMGSNKAFIKVDGVPIIERVLAVLMEVFDERLIIADEVGLFKGFSSGARAIPDFYKGAGSLGGIYTALLNSSSETAFVTACDMPDINAEAVTRVISTPLESAGAILPFIEGRPHPMHALYHRDCLGPMEEMIKSGNLRITDFLNKIAVKRLTEKDFTGLNIEASVANINTREELHSRGAGEEFTK
ncbi:MAG: molybdenum cofactor guanylyltransferase [Thermodesulfobacteriota bacterium]